LLAPPPPSGGETRRQQNPESDERPILGHRLRPVRWPDLRMKITIELNGEPYSVDAGTPVARLLEELKLKRNRVAVEINQAVVPKAEYERTIINEGDRVEVINFVGGG
jgi:sulfur carrier protein